MVSDICAHKAVSKDNYQGNKRSIGFPAQQNFKMADEIGVKLVLRCSCPIRFSRSVSGHKCEYFKARQAETSFLKIPVRYAIERERSTNI